VRISLGVYREPPAKRGEKGEDQPPTVLITGEGGTVIKDVWEKQGMSGKRAKNNVGGENEKGREAGKEVPPITPATSILQGGVAVGGTKRVKKGEGAGEGGRRRKADSKDLSPPYGPIKS